MESIRVHKDNIAVGVLRSDELGRVQFAYDVAALDQPELAISLRMPLRKAPYEDHVALPFFENLLPEGDIRRVVAMTTHHTPNDVVGLLGVLGGECAGAVSFWPMHKAPSSPPRYAPCSSHDLAAAFGSANGQSRMSSVLQDARVSMSGAQNKLVLYRRPQSGDPAEGVTLDYRLPVAGAPSTVLVKRDRGHFTGLLHNELVAMTLMRAAGVPTALYAVSALADDVYETARFDRVLAEDGTVTRLHAEDGCQLTGKVSQSKYAESGGPTYAELIAMLVRHSADARADGEILFRWAVANLALGNRDAHAKNISVLHDASGAIRIAPAYDVVCTLAYPPIDVRLPIPFGGEKYVSTLSVHALKVAAREFKLTAARAGQIAEDVINTIEAALADTLHNIAESAGHHAILDSLATTIADESTMVRGKLLAGSH
jgi:serine/threonine-protein kinase HipA